MRAVLYDEAEVEIRRAIEGQEALHSTDDIYASFYRSDLANVQWLRGDLNAAKEILTHDVPLQARALGVLQRDSIRFRFRLLPLLYVLNEEEAAEELLTEFLDRLADANRMRFFNGVYWSTRSVGWRTPTPAAPKLRGSIAELYLKRIKAEDLVLTASEQQIAVDIAKALNRSFFGDRALARRVFEATWNSVGSEGPTRPLVSSLPRFLSKNGDLDYALRLFRGLQPEAPNVSRWDSNKDGHVTGTELPAFWNQGLIRELDENADGFLEEAEAGEGFWTLLSDADWDNDGQVSVSERELASHTARFVFQDADDDGHLSDEEAQGLKPRPTDLNGDGLISHHEFVDSQRAQ